MQGYDEHHRPSKPSWIRSLLPWTVIIILLILMLFLRYGWFSFFANPELINQNNFEDFIEISPGGSFVLEFDQRMEKQTVEDAIHIDPTLSYKASWVGNSLLLKPDRPLEVGQTFTLSLGNKAKGFFGKPIRTNYDLSYVVGADPSIVKIFPDHEKIRPEESIMILFSHPMVSEQQIKMDIKPDAIRITPMIPGQWKWRNSKLLVFTPDLGFPPSGRYQLENTAPLFTFDETPINQSINQTFETERLQLLSKDDQSHRCLEEKCLVTEPFVISFNSTVSLPSLSQQASLKDSTGKILNDVVYRQLKDSATSYSVMRKDGNWLYDEHYTLGLPAELMPQYGNLSLGTGQELVFSTQSFSRGAIPFSSIKDSSRLYVVNNQVKVILQELVDQNVFQSAVTVVPDIGTEFEFIDSRTFSISFKRELQADEQANLYISDAVNSANHSFISQPIKYTLSRPPLMLVENLDSEDSVCFMSMTDLTNRSSLKVEGERQEFWSLVTGDTSSKCSERDDFPFHYSLEKKYLAPDTPITLRLEAVDIFDQKVSKDILVKSHGLNFEDIVLSLPQSSFYQYFNRAEDLKVMYSTRNVLDLKVEVCRLTAKDALRVETSYEKQWSSFQIDSQNCINSKSFSEQFEPNWGQDQDHVLILNEIFDEVPNGMYYVHVFLPTVSDPEGNPVEVGTVLQLSGWDLLSKRGESAFLWLLDHQSHQPVSDARVEWYSNDGNLIQSGVTNAVGIANEKIRKRDYDFTLVRKDNEEILLNIFHQEGFEPSRFSIPFNADENMFRYHFFVEDSGSMQNEIRGVVMVQEETEEGLSPLQQSVTLSLSNAQEEIFWKKTHELDRFGVFPFTIQSPYPLLDGNYQLSVCIGKFAGLCEGTNLWTNLMIKNGSLRQLPTTDSGSIPEPNKQQHFISVELDDEAKPGETIDVNLQGLQPGVPLLFAAERDDIYFSQVIIPENSRMSVPLKITSSMIPEVIITITQFDAQKTIYDMASIPISRQDKNLPTNGDDMHEGSFSTMAFKLRSLPDRLSDDVLEFFYPRLGTSIVTGSNQFVSVPNPPEPSMIQPMQQQSDITIINGELLSPDETKQLTGVVPLYLLVNDDTGRGNSLILHQDESLSELSLRAQIPSFIRPDDRLIIPVWVTNRGGENKNIHIISEGDGIDFLSGEKLMLGLPAGREKLLYQPTQVALNGSPQKVTLSMTLMDQDVMQSVFNGQMSVARSHHQYSTRKVIMIQSPQEQGVIEVPITKSGLFHLKTIVSPSPMSFVLENLNDALKRESLHFEEEFFKKVIAVQYFNLMQASLESDQEFSTLLDQQNSIDDELYFLVTRQKVDGGWSKNDEDPQSDPWLTANIARSLALLQQYKVEVPDAMRTNVISYLKRELETLNSKLSSYQDARKTPLLQLLNALSALTPSGIVIANNLFVERSSLSTEELVSLLLTMEDYRDAGTNGMTFKIEELTQLLKERESRTQDQVWIDEEPGGSDHLSDFMLTSWYLEALVRQASARSDIPNIITWLVRHKYQPEVQTLNDQFYFLQAMAAYLQIFHSDIKAQELTLESDGHASRSFQVAQTKPFQSFVLEDFFLNEDDQDGIPTIRFRSDSPQSWFIEVNWTQVPQTPLEIVKGISVYQELELKEPLVVGGIVTGFISIVSPEAYDHIIVAQPLTAAVRDQTENSSDDPWYTKSFGKEEKWFVIDHLPAGETIIPFQWKLDYAGIFNTPPIQVWDSNRPEIFGQSNILKLEIRSKL